jgi:hypothetical protein
VKYYIHTRGRAGNVKTLASLPAFIRERAVLVVRPEETKAYMVAHPDNDVLPLPRSVDGLSATRQWLLERDKEQVFVMMDDDITGYNYKPVLSGWKMKKCGTEKVLAAWQTMLAEAEKGDYGIVSMVDRVSAARPYKKAWAENVFTWKILVINRHVVRRAKARFDRVLIAQDVDMVLQLFRAGVKTLASVQVSMNASAIDAKGGVSIYRTDKLRLREYRKLERLHPGLCELRMKHKDGRMMPVLHKFWSKAKKEGGLK